MVRERSTHNIRNFTAVKRLTEELFFSYEADRNNIPSCTDFLLSLYCGTIFRVYNCGFKIKCVKYNKLKVKLNFREKGKLISFSNRNFVFEHT
jgi:hypothetical protein